MSFAKRFERLFHNVLPSPFTLAVGLTFFVLIAAVLFFRPAGTAFLTHSGDILNYWYQGVWNGPFLVFAYQMMLILVLGHVLALTAPATRLIEAAGRYCTDTPRAAAIVTLFSVTFGLINWGLALIFGAIFARKVAEVALKKGFKLNYPLVAASGYTGLMVWHGGISGSSLIKVAEQGHIQNLVAGNTAMAGVALPDVIGFSQTVFSPMNLIVVALLLLTLPLTAFLIGKRVEARAFSLSELETESPEPKARGWAERFDYYRFPAFFLGFLALGASVWVAVESVREGSPSFVTPNFLNLIFLGLGLLAHGSLSNFGHAVSDAIKGAAGIFIQFPLYFGIMGVMQHAGIVSGISDFFVSISNADTYPIFTFFSAGFINILVPSGGGQWMVQGPIIIEAATRMGLPLGKSILALAYGDQITNMIQPFWALPLLAITGLRARDILPFTLIFMGVGMVIYLGALAFI